MFGFVTLDLLDHVKVASGCATRTKTTFSCDSVEVKVEGQRRMFHTSGGRQNPLWEGPSALEARTSPNGEAGLGIAQ